MISSNPPRVVSKRNFALGGWKIDTSTNDHNISVEAKSSKNALNILTFKKGEPSQVSGSGMSNETNAILTLPKSMFTTLPAGVSTFDVVSVVYSHNKLFTTNSSKTGKESNILHLTPVIYWILTIIVVKC